MRPAKRFVTATILVGSILAATSAQGFELGGYYKNFFVADRLPGAVYQQAGLDAPWVGSVSQRLRLDAFHRFGDKLAFNVSYSLSARVQDPVLFGDLLYTNAPFIGFINAAGYRAFDLEALLMPRDASSVRSFAVFQNLDRVFATISVEWFDVYVGRQAIAWGSARVVNPTDVIAPFLYTELDTENRIGVDAVRLRAPIGALGEFDAGYVAGDDFDLSESAFFLRGRDYVAETDVSALLLGFREHLLIGADITRSFGGAGSWFEAAYVFADAFGDHRDGSGDDYLRFSIGCDYSFPHNIYAFVEYHFNEPGTNDAGEYGQIVDSPAYRDGANYLLGEHFLAPGATFQVTPLVTLLGQALVNLTDPSALLVGTLEYNIGENIDLEFGTYVGLGKNPALRAMPFAGTPRLVFNSEFGSYADMVYTSFRVYF